MKQKKLINASLFIAPFLIFSGFISENRPRPNEVRINQNKLIDDKVEQTLEEKYQLRLDGIGGSATLYKRKILYSTYIASYHEIHSQKEAEKKFLLSLLEILHLLNSTEELHDYLAVRPFTLHNLNYTVWNVVERPDKDSSKFLLLRVYCRLGEITAEYHDNLNAPFSCEKLDFAAIYNSFQNEVPEYLKKTAQQILGCPRVEKKELEKRYDHLRLHDESL